MSLGRSRVLVLVAALFGGVLGACPPTSGLRPIARAAASAPAGSQSDGRPSMPTLANSAPIEATRSGVDGPPNASRPSEVEASPASSAAAPVSQGAAPSIEQELDGPPLLDAEGKPLAQTEDRPSSTSAAFARRIRALARAIIEGDAELALRSFFPLPAYRQVKDIAKPERDYDYRLLANFRRDLLQYHRALGGDAKQATFTSVTVHEQDVKWMPPGSEGNKLGYFRVLRSRLHFTLPGGRTREFELTSLISWRGEWYVVHLHGFE